MASAGDGLNKDMLLKGWPIAMKTAVKICVQVQCRSCNEKRQPMML